MACSSYFLTLLGQYINRKLFVIRLLPENGRLGLRLVWQHGKADQSTSRVEARETTQ